MISDLYKTLQASQQVVWLHKNTAYTRPVINYSWVEGLSQLAFIGEVTIISHGKNSHWDKVEKKKNPEKFK